MKKHRGLVIVVWIACVGIILLHASIWYFNFPLRWGSTWAAYYVPAVVVETLIILRVRRTIRLELRRMFNQDFWCHNCDYLLHQNTSGRCPECGEEIPARQQILIKHQSWRVDPAVN